VLSMRENGGVIKKTDEEKKYGWTELLLTANGRMENFLAMEFTPGLQEAYIKEAGANTSEMVSDEMCGLKRTSMKENGSKIKRVAWALIHGLMAEFTPVIGRTINAAEEALLSGLLWAINTKAIG